MKCTPAGGPFDEASTMACARISVRLGGVATDKPRSSFLIFMIVLRTTRSLHQLGLAPRNRWAAILGPCVVYRIEHRELMGSVQPTSTLIKRNDRSGAYPVV